MWCLVLLIFVDIQVVFTNWTPPSEHVDDQHMIASISQQHHRRAMSVLLTPCHFCRYGSLLKPECRIRSQSSPQDIQMLDFALETDQPSSITTHPHPILILIFIIFAQLRCHTVLVLLL